MPATARAVCPSQHAEVRDDIVLLGGGELGAEDHVEELDRIFEREQPAIVQVGRRVLDAAERERLEDPLGPTFVEALHAQIVRQVVGGVLAWMAGRAAPLALEYHLASKLGGGGLRAIEVPGREQLGRRR